MNRCYNFNYKRLKEKATTSNSLSSEVIEKFHIFEF